MYMKGIKLWAIALFVIGAMSACGSKDAEERIAEYESQLAELEKGAPAATTTTTPALTPATPAAAATTASTNPEGPVPAFAFNETVHDFGTIVEGEVVTHTFSFTNTGEAPLIIEKAQASCGCTVPKWPREPIPVGGTGEIEVRFDSKNKTGVQNKTVTITANTYPQISRLNIKTFVEKASTTTSADGPVRK
jgi:hypothetical protein